jgi:hypothetical protein
MHVNIYEMEPLKHADKEWLSKIYLIGKAKNSWYNVVQLHMCGRYVYLSGCTYACVFTYMLMWMYTYILYFCTVNCVTTQKVEKEGKKKTAFHFISFVICIICYHMDGYVLQLFK